MRKLSQIQGDLIFIVLLVNHSEFVSARGIVTTRTLADNPGYIGILNYFEYPGALWNRKNIDKYIIREYLYGYVVISFNLFRRYIEDSRKDYRNPVYCSNWENMVDELNRRAFVFRSR